MITSIANRVSSLFSGWLGTPSRERLGCDTWRVLLSSVVPCCVTSIYWLRFMIVSTSGGAGAGLFVSGLKVGNLALDLRGRWS